MANLTKDNPARTQRDAAIVAMRCQGKSHREIAKAHHIHPTTVGRILSDDDCIKIIEDTQREYIKAMPEIRAEFLALCQDENKSIKTANIKEYHKITGIAPTHTHTQFIQNVYNDNRQILSDDTAKILVDAIAPTTKAIEADYEVISGD